MSEGRRIRRRFGHRFGGWLAIVALFAQIVVAAVHRPAPVVFASPAMTLAGFVALFGDQVSLCQPRDCQDFRVKAVSITPR